MNPVTVREEAIKLSDKIFPEINAVKYLASVPLMAIPTAVLHGNMGDLFNEEGKTRVPFKCFIYQNKRPEGTGISIVSDGDDHVQIAMQFTFKASGHKMITRAAIQKGKYGKFDFIVDELIAGQWSGIDDLASARPILFVSIAPIILFISGLTQVVSVHPPTNKQVGKSREWIKAREYYTVVHRRHAANVKGVKEGAVVSDKSEKHIAHARRAHERILRSPRWGKSMGKKLWVKSCWVGPKEWQDEASKQVYRVYEPAKK